jgi:hypothetical protein
MNCFMSATQKLVPSASYGCNEILNGMKRWCEGHATAREPVGMVDVRA